MGLTDVKQRGRWRIVRILSLSFAVLVMSVAAVTISASSGAALSVVQYQLNVLSSAGSTTVTFSKPATAGDLLVATGIVDPNTASPTGPSGFTLAGSTTGNDDVGAAVLWYKTAVGGETSFTFSQTGSDVYSEFGVTEISGVSASALVDGTPAWQSSTSSVTGYTQTYGSTPAASGELAFAFFGTVSATAQTTPSGWSLIAGPSTSKDNAGYYFKATTTSAPSITTSGLTPAGGYVAGMVLFKAPTTTTTTAPTTTTTAPTTTTTAPTTTTTAPTTTTTAPTTTTTAPPPPSASRPHVMMIMLENTDYSQFLGSTDMPYLNELATDYALFTHAYGWNDGDSLPNYLALIAGTDDLTLSNGSTYTVNTDCTPDESDCGPFTNTTLVDQLNAAGVSWNAYYQGDSSGCYSGTGNGTNGRYPYWHNPFLYFADFGSVCANISNFEDLNSNLNSANPADFQWVVPDLVNSGGDDGTMSSEDSWLNGELPEIMSSNWYQSGGQIIISWDTSYQASGGLNGSTGGPIPTLVISSHTLGMGAITTPINTVGILYSIEKAYGLAYLAAGADPNDANGSLGNALVSEVMPQPFFEGATLGITISGGPASLTPAGSGVVNLKGVAESTPGTASSAIEVGGGANGEGVVASSSQGAVSVPGTSTLESVACESTTQCYAVGLGPLSDDSAEGAVLVSIVNGAVSSVTDDEAFIGLYGIACPTSTMCVAVGYDTNDADAATTITNGSMGSPVELANSKQWLNAISCTSSTQCYAVGLDNQTPIIVPIDSGSFGSAITIPNSFYVNAVYCASSGNCLMVGENGSQDGIVSTLVDGKAGATTVVPGTEYLYGVGCGSSDGNCVLTGTSSPGSSGYATGVVVSYNASSAIGTVDPVADSNGFGQVTCGATISTCIAVGAALEP